MEHVTACYWQKETPAELFLSLQQRKYRRLGISVVCACISDNGELVRSLQNKMEEELEEENVWRPFREEILHVNIGRGAFHSALKVRREPCWSVWKSSIK